MATLFERLGKGRDTVESGGVARKLLPAQKLLDWLQHWTKPTVSARDICIYGPNSLRDRRSAIDAAEILAKTGWLLPNKTRRHDIHEWQIVRKPIVQPTVATVAVNPLLFEPEFV